MTNDRVDVILTKRIERKKYRAKDIEEMNGYFLMFNKMLDALREPLSQEVIMGFHLNDAFMGKEFLCYRFFHICRLNC